MKRRTSSFILLLGFTLPAFANHPPEPATVTGPGKFYIGIFGGGGSSNNFNTSQFGTAFYPDSSGGPLAVNAFGNLNSKSASFFGAQLGYKAKEISLHPSLQWTLAPAAELEGYSMSQSSFSGDLINNTTRLPEHDFLVTYPMNRTVFLANAIISFNHPRLLVHPNIGFGIGNAIIRIAGANAAQTSPPEAGVNHYNTDPNDTNSTFAGQIKLGLSYDINKYVSVFADYRWLYLAGTHFIFGSTSYTTHPATSPWQVNMDAQKYNLGSIGIRLNF